MKHSGSVVPAWVAVALVVSLALLNGCVAAPAPVAPAEVAPTGDGLTYYFLAANNHDPFYVDGVAGFEAAGAELGVKTEFVGPMDLNLASQMQTLEELIANPTTGGIFFYVMDFNAADPLIKESEAKGVPVVIGAADSPFKSRSAFIGYDNSVLGVQAAEAAVKILSGSGTVGSIGVTGPGVTQRRAAFEAHLKATYPDIEVVPTASHDGSAASAAQTLEAYMVAHPDLSLLWWADGLAGQMVQPWKEQQEAGVTTQFLAMDMPQPTLQAVADGTYVGSIGQDTRTEEAWGHRLLYAKRHGERIPDTVYLSALIITKDNVDQFLKK